MKVLFSCFLLSNKVSHLSAKELVWFSFSSIESFLLSCDIKLFNFYSFLANEETHICEYSYCKDASS